MKAPTIILQQRPGGASAYGFTLVNDDWVFGTVVATYPNCPNWCINDIVFFDLTKAVRFLFGTINYYAIDEAYIYFAETPVL